MPVVSMWGDTIGIFRCDSVTVPNFRLIISARLIMRPSEKITLDRFFYNATHLAMTLLILPITCNGICFPQEALTDAQMYIGFAIFSLIRSAKLVLISHQFIFIRVILILKLYRIFINIWINK